MVRTHFATCALCEATCGIIVETEGRDVISIRGDDKDPLSRGYICPKAIALKDLFDDPDRLRTPIRKTLSGWQDITWQQAFDEAAHGLQAVQHKYGRHALAVYQGNPTVHSLGALTFGQLFMTRLRTRNRYSATSVDQLPHMLAALLMFGNQLLIPVPDIDRTDHMIIMGGNPVVSNGSIMTAPDIRRRLSAIRARGGKVVVIDPRRTETAAVADEHHFIRPATDALLLLAVLHILFAENRAELGRLEPFTGGIDAVREVCAPFSPESVSPVVGMDSHTIRVIARELSDAKSAVVYGRLGICTQEFGGLCAWLINVINIVTGNLDRAGGAMFATPAFNLPALGPRLGLVGHFGKWTSRVRGLPEFGGEAPVASMADEMLTSGKDQVRALFITAGNPVLSVPNGRKLDRALAGLDFMVAVDPYINETTRHADIILPPTTILERDHYDVAFEIFMVRNRAKFSEAVFARTPDQRHDWEIFAELLSRWNAGDGLLARATAATKRKTLLALGPRAAVKLALRIGPQDVTLGHLLRSPHGIDLGPLEPRLPNSLATSDKRIDLAPTAYLDDIPRLASRADQLANDGMVLIGRRHLRSNNSWMHNSPGLMTGKPRCTLLIHPADAKNIGIVEGQSARVTSRTGQAIVATHITDEIMPGVVSLPHGWGHDRRGTRLRVASERPGVSANDLGDDQLVDELSGNATLNGVPVRVEAV